jgi:hypothetical protein
MLGLLLWAIVIAFLGYVAVRALPTVNEYATIKRAVEKIVANPPATVPEIRSAFDKQQQVEYSIQSINSKDLVVTKENEQVVISFAYDKEIPLVGPVYLLIKYEGRAVSPRMK